MTGTTSLERFLAHVATVGAMRSRRDPDWRLYGELKRQLDRECPPLEPGQYDRAIAAIAKATGV